MAADYHIFEGLTIRNTEVAFWAGLKNVLGATGLTVRNCRIEDVGIGVDAYKASGPENLPAHRRERLPGSRDHPTACWWSGTDMYGAHPLKSYYAVKVYGSGHAIAHDVAHFHDGIDSDDGGRRCDRDHWAVAIDIYNNDIYMLGDDFIETDGGVHNIRVLRNRGVNAAQSGLSAQPVFGGPCDLHPQRPLPRRHRHRAQVHGQAVGSRPLPQHHHLRGPEPRSLLQRALPNNLFLGTDSGTRGIVVFPNQTSYSSYDYDGFRANRGAADQFLWFSPAQGQLRDFSFAAQNRRSFKTLADMAEATGQESHGIEVDYDIFENLRPPEANKPHAVYRAADLNFRLRPGSKAVDAG